MESEKMKEPKVVILNITHGSNPYMDQPPFLPIAAGACRSDITNDASGEDNISAKNKWYGDFSSLYWAWKNLKDVDIIGTSHYRRYLCDVDELSEWQGEYVISTEKFMQRKYNVPLLTGLLETCDFVMLKEWQFECTVKEQYITNHPYPKNIDITTEALRKIHPEAVGTWLQLLEEKTFQPGYLFLTRWSLFDELCAWIYPVLQEIESHIDLNQYDGYQGRVVAFLYERLVPVFIKYKGCRVTQRAVYKLDSEINVSIDDYLEKCHHRDTSVEVVSLLKNKKCRTDFWKSVAGTKAEYVALVNEGDSKESDFVKRSVGFLQVHLEYSMSAGVVRDWDKTDPTVNFRKQIIQGNQIDTLSSCVFRGEYLRKIAEENPNLPLSEWLIGVLMAQYGHIGLIPAEHPAFGKGERCKILQHFKLLANANYYDRLLQHKYHDYWVKSKQYHWSDFRCNFMHYMPQWVQTLWHALKHKR